MVVSLQALASGKYCLGVFEYDESGANTATSDFADNFLSCLYFSILVRECVILCSVLGVLCRMGGENATIQELK